VRVPLFAFPGYGLRATSYGGGSSRTASGAAGEGVVGVEAGGEGHVAELVDGDLGQACDKFVQFLVRHSVYTQEKPGRFAGRRADRQLSTAKKILAGVCDIISWQCISFSMTAC
jgi:hypothetical protein